MRTDEDIIPIKIDESISTDTERLFINCSMFALHAYYKTRVDFSIIYQQQYIKNLLYAVDFLYEYYDLEPIYFSLLDHAVHTLEKLASSGKHLIT